MMLLSTLQRRACFFASAILILHVELYANEKSIAPPVRQTKPSCGNSPRPMRAAVRHIEASGIGYNQGYSTLEGFFASPQFNTWLAFVDLRGHIFNNGKPAANAGFGLRHLSSRVWGINGYYDYRKTNQLHYNQVSVGLESLGETWDFRLNGYLPVGPRKSSFFHPHFTFDSFKNHYMVLSNKREIAMRGMNAEAAVHAAQYKNVSLYFAAGTYCLKGIQRTAWGGEARAVMNVSEHARFEGSASYDTVFKWIGQGQISLIVPFGRKKQVNQRKKSSCQTALRLSDRAYQHVDRNEIIPVLREKKKVKAINPATGDPYFFWFVDNTSHSNGTFESPFNTLAAAQNASSPDEVIYVFPGDGTSTGMNQGITIKGGQKLFGAGTRQTMSTTLGAIVIPPLAHGMPLITQPNPLLSVITCIGNNEISGTHISHPNLGAALPDLIGDTPLAGISCIGTPNIFIHDNTIEILTPDKGGVDNGLPQNALLFMGCSGQITVLNNIVSLTSFGTLVHVMYSDPKADYVIEGNQFYDPAPNSQTRGIDLGFSSQSLIVGESVSVPLSFHSLIISKNQFTNLGFNTAGAALGEAIGGNIATFQLVVLDTNTFSHIGVSSLLLEYCSGCSPI